MEALERIAARVGRVACSPDNSQEELLESAALVSELASEFEDFKRRASETAVESASSRADSSAPEPATDEELAQALHDIVHTK